MCAQDPNGKALHHQPRFPGDYERNLYRFMDARDGFNYMAVPITCAETQINV